MRYLKVLGLATLAVTHLLTFVGGAAATTLTSPIGTIYPRGGEIKASANLIQTDGPLIKTEFSDTECQESTFKGQIEKVGGVSETVRIPLSQFVLQKCSGGPTISVLKPGSLEIHTDTASADGNGIVIWSGAEITILTHRSFFGFPYTEHCIYYTENIPFGTLTGSVNREGKTALLDIGSFEFLNRETDSNCGEPIWTGSYTIETPDYLSVD